MAKNGGKLNLAMSEAVEAIKASVTCFDVARLVGSDLSHGFIRCGSERTRSCHIKADSFYCYSCGRYGDVISFYQHETGASFKEAVKVLDKAFGIFILDSALSEAEQEKIKRAIERKEQKRRYCAFWGRKSDYWRNYLITRKRILEILFRRLEPKYAADLYNSAESFETELFLCIDEALDKCEALLDCIDEVDKSTYFDSRFGYAFDKESAKVRHFRTVKALSEDDLWEEL